MSSTGPVPAAQYLRMSTEHQQYSLDNQADVIRQYADSHGFEVVQTYADPGKSGLVLKHREGLAQMLKDVVGGPQPYKVVLVYDVSRWGRFQDTDESAYYEFLCKRSGIPIHYCGETFINDQTMPSVVMKALKRVMAAEYSRDLSYKVFQGAQRINQLGFRTGGPAGYGLRKMLCSIDGKHKQLLGPAERKSIMTDRVTLVPGPPNEVECVRQIYQMIIEHKTLQEVSDELNGRGIPYFDRKWQVSGVVGIVKNPKYMGCNVWGRCAKKLGGPRVRQLEKCWTKKLLAFEPLVSEATFAAAQAALKRSWTDEELLTPLRSLLATTGWLTQNLVNNARGVPCVSAYCTRFGGLTKAYELIGYRPSRQHCVESFRHSVRLRDELVQTLLGLFPGKLYEQKRSGNYSPKLRFRNGPAFSIVLSRTIRTPSGQIRWQVQGEPEPKGVTLFCRFNEDNTAFKDYYVFSRLKEGRSRLKRNDRFFKSGKRLKDLSRLLDAARSVRS